mmetsp:Transcript_106212/g.298644  ORF Transcript_106212/g.298644 Transcript_106212/m.298644 type:complete len:216 (+) Transcript_106212:191-838(+)
MPRKSARMRRNGSSGWPTHTRYSATRGNAKSITSSARTDCGRAALASALTPAGSSAGSSEGLTPAGLTAAAMVRGSSSPRRADAGGSPRQYPKIRPMSSKTRSTSSGISSQMSKTSSGKAPTSITEIGNENSVGCRKCSKIWTRRQPLRRLCAGPVRRQRRAKNGPRRLQPRRVLHRQSRCFSQAQKMPGSARLMAATPRMNMPKPWPCRTNLVR